MTMYTFHPLPTPPLTTPTPGTPSGSSSSSNMHTAALEAHAAQMGSFARRLSAQAALVADRAKAMEEAARLSSSTPPTPESDAQTPPPLPPFLFDVRPSSSAQAQALEWARMLASRLPPSHPHLHPHAADHARTKAALERRRAEARARAAAELARRRAARDAEERELARAYEVYESRWGEMSLLSPTSPGASGTTDLSFHHIPWPCHPPPSSPSDLKPIKIQKFLLSPLHSRNQGPKERVRQALLRWHPDKFEGRWMGRVRMEERGRVREGVRCVVGALREVQDELGRRGVWSP